MQKKEYYCFVAGLPDLFFDENKQAFNSLNFRNELKHQLTQSDYKLVEYLFLPFDNKNLLNLLFQQKKYFQPLGTLSKNTLKTQLSPSNEGINLPEYMIHFLNWAKESDSKDFTIEAENLLNCFFYEQVLKVKNVFLQNWFLFELNTKNILTAFNCINFNYELTEHLLKVESNNLVYSLLINKRLKAELFEDELPFTEQIFKIAESNLELIEKEKAIDKIKWDFIDENTFFHYFTIEKILGFIIKLQITERWMNLDEETGKIILERLINDLKTNYELQLEFNLTQ